MGAAKRLMERRDAVGAAAAEVAVEVGMLERCEEPSCGEIRDPLAGDLFDEARALLEEKLSRGELEYGRDELVDALRGICEEYPEECFCQRQWAKTEAE